MRLGWVCFAGAAFAAACTLDRAGTLQGGLGGGGEAPATTSAGGSCVVEACPGHGAICTHVECLLDGSCSAPAPAPGAPCTLDAREGVCSPSEVGLCLVDLGSDCAATTDCQSGHCVDGVCCDDACDAPCFGCAGGSCGPIEAGTGDDGCEVCDGTGQCLTGTPLWANVLGPSGNQELTSVAIGASGDVVVGGFFSGSIDFAAIDTPAVNSVDGAALTFAADSAPKPPGRFVVGQGEERIEAVTVDHLGRIVVCGWFTNDIDLDGATISASNEDAFVVAIDPTTGEHVWSHTFGMSGTDQCMGVAADLANQGVVVTGWFSGSDVEFGPHLLSTAGNRDVFVARIDASGAVIWARRGHGNNDQEAYDVAVDALGNAFVTGRFEDTIDFGKGPQSAAGAWSAFVTKLAVSGDETWTKTFGDASGETGTGGVAVAGGRIVLAGATNATLNLEGTAFDPDGFDALVIALDDDGTVAWHDFFGHESDQAFRKVAIDPDGHVVLVGYGRGTTTVGSEVLTATDCDALLVKLDPTGVELWGASFGGVGDVFGFDVAIDASGTIFAVGRFADELTIGSVAETASGIDAWLAAFEP